MHPPAFVDLPSCSHRRCGRQEEDECYPIEIGQRPFRCGSGNYLEAPKRPRTAYNLFFRDQQDKINQMKSLFQNKSVNAAKIVASCWKDLDPTQKAHYCQLAWDDKLRYYNEKMAYQQAMEEADQAATTTTLDRSHRLHEGEEESSTTCMSMEDLSSSSSSLTTTGRADPTNQGPTIGTSAPRDDHEVPPYSRASMALLASHLDAKSIRFLIQALK
uniref:HMG box domain-containing protein n=1 Tax=Amphora coffeiformis TaxID=265554 RepID=A0A7S3P9I0_9STRA